MKQRNGLKTCLAATVAALLAASSLEATTIRFVKEGGTGTGTGNWLNASGDLQAMINQSAAYDEVWVATGEYEPASSTGFTLEDRVRVYGGFAGTEDPATFDPENDVRNFAANPTTLDGDNSKATVVYANGVDQYTLLDGFTITGATEHAIWCVNQSKPTFSNLIVTGNQSSADPGGAGILNEGSSPSLSNCVFSNNTSAGLGGAMTNFRDSSWRYSHPVIESCLFENNTSTRTNGAGAVFSDGNCYPRIENCEFVQNQATGTYAKSGAIRQTSCGDSSAGRRFILRTCSFRQNSADDAGALYLYGGSGTLDALVINCTFQGNTATNGGATRCSYTDIINCSFFGNSATDDGGAIFTQGAIDLINSEFSGNIAGTSGSGVGGAVYCSGNGFTMINCTLSSNQASSENGGGGIAFSNVVSTVQNSIFWNNTSNDTSTEDNQILAARSTVNVTHSCIQGLDNFEGNNNIGDDPLFADELGSENTAPGTGDEQLWLLHGSPCLDAGTNAVLPADTYDLDEDGVTTGEFAPDLRLYKRVIKYNSVDSLGNCDSVLVDMGAHELADDCNANGILDYAEIDACDNDPGCADIDTNDDTILDACQDCNGNGVFDVEDITSLFSPDCNANCIPDECDIDESSTAPGGPFFCTAHCDPDCNNNGTPDACDAAVEDCNENGIPDECDFDYDCNLNCQEDALDISTGISPDCNGNGIPDECDVDPANPSGSEDCNENTVPDECELSTHDCNTNGIPDNCDIAECDGSAWCSDCNMNAIPDACDIDSGDSDDCNDNDVPDDCELLNHVSSRGREFILTFLQNDLEGRQPDIELHITSDLDALATIEYPMLNPTWALTDIPITGGEVTVITGIPTDAAQGWNASTTQDNAVHVTATEEVTCQMVNRMHASSDAALALPVGAMGTSYIVVTPSHLTTLKAGGDGWANEFAVVAKEDSTNVTLIPSQAIMNPPSSEGPPYLIPLNRGQGFLCLSNSSSGPTADLTGTRIIADKPVGVTNGRCCLKIPAGCSACDHVFEVAQPLEGWGTYFLATSLPHCEGLGSVYKVVASGDTTTVYLDGNQLVQLNAGASHDITALEGSHLFESDKPILLLQFMPSADYDPSYINRDPAMVNLPPVSQFQSEHVFHTVGDDQFIEHWVTVYAHNNDLSAITLDGEIIEADAFTPIPNTSYSSAVLPLDEGMTHHTASWGAHGITVEGYEEYGSYIYPGSAILRFPSLEADCNDNGDLDECEIGDGTADDCDLNGIIDECQETLPPPIHIYVDDDGASTNSGTNWNDARPDLAGVLSYANSLPCNRIEVHVAQGVYYPSNTGDRDVSFELGKGVKIRGGYRGLSASPGEDPDDRDIQEFVTLLEGDYGTIGDYSDNASHLITAENVDATAVLDGFFIRHGNAGSAGADPTGGGALITSASPIISNCTFECNHAATYGGTIQINGGSPTIVNCFIAKGLANQGGGVNVMGSSEPIFVNCAFVDNQAWFLGGGLACCDAASPAVVNCTFSGNVGSDQGGGLLTMPDATGICTVTNSIFWGNWDSLSQSIRGRQITEGAADSIAVTYSCVQDDEPNVYPGTGNIAYDPKFETGLFLRLSAASPCIDAGNREAVPADVADLDGDNDTTEPTPLDLDLLPRLVDDPRQSEGGEPRPDMGAHEFQAPALLNHGSKMEHDTENYYVPSGSVEGRDIQGTLVLSFEYDQPVYSEDGNAFVSTDFTIYNGDFVKVELSTDMKTLEVECDNVADGGCFGIAFTVENGVGNEVTREFEWQILAGDVNGDGAIDAVDLSTIGSNTNIPLDDLLFRCDVNANGTIAGNTMNPVEDWAFVNAALGADVQACTPVLSNMYSRKYHSATYFDIEAGDVEPRTGDKRFVFIFDRDVRSVDDDDFVASDFTVSSGTITNVILLNQRNEFFVDVSGITDQELFLISFDAEDDYDFPLSVEACWPMLIGDVNGSGEVDVQDAAQIAKRNGTSIGATSFRCDLDCDGAIEGVSPIDDDAVIANTNATHTVMPCRSVQ